MLFYVKYSFLLPNSCRRVLGWKLVLTATPSIPSLNWFCSVNQKPLGCLCVMKERFPCRAIFTRDMMSFALSVIQEWFLQEQIET